jgi:hypothetical protein
MDPNRIIELLGTLSRTDFARVQAEVNRLAALYDDWQAPTEDSPTNEAHSPTYRQEYTKCNKPSCKRCSESQGHGPYWYSYQREGGKLKKTYIGKQLPAGTKKAHPEG